MWDLLTIVFNAIGTLLLIQFIGYKINDFRNCTNPAEFFTFQRHKYVITVVGLLLSTFLVLALLVPEVSPLRDEAMRIRFNTVLGIAAALGISAIWGVYLRKLDIFDPEKWTNVLLVFGLGCLTVWIVFPVSAFLRNQGFYLNGGALNDFIYCVAGIGMVEEFVKLLPLLVIIRYKHVVREPYDFLLYASVSALGFAFIENALYIQKTNFYAINGRALMATVAHMTFSSVVGYSVMISVYKKNLWGWRYLLGGFLLASFMHGFYDFWLINKVVRQYNGLTFLFFLLTTHFWFSMKNKTINASRYYNPHHGLVNDKLRYFLIFWLSFLLLGSGLLIGIAHGRFMAYSFLHGQLYAFGFLLLYLSFSFSRFKIAPRVLRPGQKLIDAMIPQEPRPNISSWGAE